MSSSYLYSLTVVATEADATAVRELFCQFECCTETPLSTPLSGDGSTISHYAAHTYITEVQRQELLALMSGGGVPGSTRYLIVGLSDEAVTVAGTNLEGFVPDQLSDSFDLFAVMGISPHYTSGV